MDTKKIDFLLKVSQRFIGVRDFDSIINNVLKTVKKEFELVTCGLLLYNQEREAIHLKRVVGIAKKYIEKITIPVGKGISGKCAEQRETIYIADVSKDPTYVEKYSSTKSELSIPLVSEKELFGVLNFEKKKVNGFTKEDIKLLEIFSSIISIALENTLFFEDKRKKEKQQLELIEIAKTASETMDEKTVYGKLVSLGAKLVNAKKCTISLYDSETGEVTAQLPGYGSTPDLIRKFHFNLSEQSTAAKVLAAGESYLTNDAPNDPYIIQRFVKLFGVKRLIVSPLKTSKEIIGLLYATRGKGSKPYNESDKDILIIFSSLAASIIKTMQFFNELKQKKEELEVLTGKLRERNEELQDLNFVKSHLISNISHELKTPLVSIKGYTDLLSRKKFGNLNEKQKLSLTAIKRNAERLLNSIDNLIDTSKLELGAAEKIDMELINIFSLLDEVIELILNRADEKGITIKKKYEAKNLIVEANREKLLRAFYNIIENAVKFNKKKGKIAIRCYRNDGNVVTEIKDTGIGISERYNRLIFNRFFQVDSSDKRIHRGSGIGLSLSYEIITFFKGDIQFKSKPNKGSTFTITLPAAFIKK